MRIKYPFLTLTLLLNENRAKRPLNVTREEKVVN